MEKKIKCKECQYYLEFKRQMKDGSRVPSAFCRYLNKFVGIDNEKTRCKYYKKDQ